MTSRASLLVAVAVFAIALGYAAVADSYAVFLIATISLTAIACIGLNVLLGLAGQISLGHIGFMAIGAYTTVLLMEKAGWPYLAATAGAIVLVSIVGGLLAMPALRVRGPYLAMVTIAFGFIVEHVTIEWRDLTGGGNGLMLSAPPSVFGYALSERSLAIAGIVLVFAGLILFERLKRSGWGYAMRAARDTEVATRSLGIDLVHVRAVAFVISAAAMALAGALFAPLQGYISPSSFPFLQSVLLLFGVMVGGAGSAFGPVIGAALVVLLPEALSDLAEYRLLAFGVLLFVVLRAAPSGIVGLAEQLAAKLLPAGKPVAEPAIAAANVDAAILATRSAAGLDVTDLSISFGGVRAVQGVTFKAAPGAVTSIIGPNGAGKTSALNLLSGFYRSQAGTVKLGDRDITGMTSHLLARVGVARTFQTTQLFGSLSILENILLAERVGRLGGIVSALRNAETEGFARFLLRFAGVDGDADRLADSLSHGEKRLVEIARALALRPRILLLDEPAAGLSKGDKQRLTALLRRIADLGIAVIIVEHDMPMIMSLSDLIVVLDGGKRIAIGDAAAIRNDPLVRKAYLGDATPGEKSRAPRPARQGTALEVKTLDAFYGLSRALNGIDLVVAPGEAVAVLGANGAGKTTLMRSIAGLEPPRSTGEVRLAETRIDRLPAHVRARSGVVLVPEGRQVFPELTVKQNLQLGAYARKGLDLDAAIEAMFVRFPRLKERIDQRAGLLSGGEQQMLAVARGLLTGPKIFMLDEPSLGLAPLVVDELFASFERLRSEGMTIIVVDQMAGHALALADRAYLLETGAILKSGAADIIAEDPLLEAAYLGGEAQAGAPQRFAAQAR
ncbi:High-affinity branched-chain amino acid transport ATP-binding protein LivF [Bradyrhizobium ivorense]|uniref:High-affinity branched-chain amino acid transport ATP-binding protein LivF n=1 Tax=Bradyrhizobium ivorense TaxID=2511166 RepID=A0A508TE03_9BRAD|nr:branched-chain amino acid ABC transporter ATP-binding protein/permease [Bradyrhizobium ivorense]VIO72516.1 High-affinity branched-chain amino acid transport ATP-binding protein LivF [Bradyrhizobium ivorense]